MPEKRGFRGRYLKRKCCGTTGRWFLWLWERSHSFGVGPPGPFLRPATLPQRLPKASAEPKTLNLAFDQDVEEVGLAAGEGSF